MDSLGILIPLLPLIAAATIGIGHWSGLIHGAAGEEPAAGLALWSVAMSALLSITLLVSDLMGINSGYLVLGDWLTSDKWVVEINFITGGLNVGLAALFSLLLTCVVHFSVNYMHKEAGFIRFFGLLSLFSSAMLLLVLSGNAVLTFVGWELAGVCSYFLVAYAYHRDTAARNASRVFVTNRIGDAGFIIGIGLCFLWADTVNWRSLNLLVEQFTFGEATGIALCFTVAAMAKSAQLPFTPWIGRALEGPTPSSAVFYGSVMVHAGVFLILLIQPMIEKSIFVMILLSLVGALSAFYGYFVGLTQTDIKSSLAFATVSQIGLMFFECGIGLWNLATWHLCAHAVVRCYQFLVAPSLLHNVKGIPIRPVPAALSRQHWAFAISLHRFWLEQFIDWVLVKPVCRLGQDLAYLDRRVVDRIVGSPAPAIHAISSLAQLEERKIGSLLENKSDRFAQGSGLAALLTYWFANLLHWFEDKFVLPEAHKERLGRARRVAIAVMRFEHLILRPRYLVLFVFITLLVAF